MKGSLRRVVSSVLLWEGNPHQLRWPGDRTFRREKLECGHIDDFGTKPRPKRRCFECNRSNTKGV